MRPISTGYKELSMPADAAGHHRMACDALPHLAAGNYMLIALRTRTAAFTATLFLAKRGAASFESLTDTSHRSILSRSSRCVRLDARIVSKNSNKSSRRVLGTVSASPSALSGHRGLIGRLGARIVPFHRSGE